MAGSVDSGVYFPDIIKGDEIGVLYKEGGVANTAKVSASEFSENYGEIPLKYREKLTNYALRKIPSLKEETEAGREALISELSRLTINEIRERNGILDPIVETAIKLEDYGMPESKVGGSDEDIMELAIDCIGEEKIESSIDDYGLAVKCIVQQANEFVEKYNLLGQQKEELNKLQELYQSLK